MYVIPNLNILKKTSFTPVPATISADFGKKKHGWGEVFQQYGRVGGWVFMTFFLKIATPARHLVNCEALLLHPSILTRMP